LRGNENLSGGFCEIEAQLDREVDFHGRGALHGHADFAEVEDLVKIEHDALRCAPKTGIGGHVHFVAHATTAIGDSER
jgi:hypothetical protein